MTASSFPSLVSTTWLAENITAPDLRIIDASWHMPATGRDGHAEYEREHIRGAVFFDIDEIADTRSPLPHMLPPVEKFISRVRQLGVGDGHRIVVYDSHGLFSAARVWWMFRYFGTREVAVLDGGLPKWKAEGHPVTDDRMPLQDRHYTARCDASLVRDVTQVAAASKSSEPQIIDARSGERFRGDVPEPREGLAAGHIPRSLNVPFTTLLNADGTMKAPDDLLLVFTEAGVDPSRPAITTCGSGVTAAIISLALEQLGNRHHALYDGSWTEWGSHPSLGIATG